METKANRTLVKSAPELWELADDIARMEAWMTGLVGSAQPIPVEVTDREPERILAWRTANGGPYGRIALELGEKGGLGTSVVITAQHQGADPGVADALEGVLDDLGY